MMLFPRRSVLLALFSFTFLHIQPVQAAFWPWILMATAFFQSSESKIFSGYSLRGGTSGDQSIFGLNGEVDRGGIWVRQADLVYAPRYKVTQGGRKPVAGLGDQSILGLNGEVDRESWQKKLVASSPQQEQNAVLRAELLLETVYYNWNYEYLEALAVFEDLFKKIPRARFLESFKSNWIELPAQTQNAYLSPEKWVERKIFFNRIFEMLTEDGQLDCLKKVLLTPLDSRGNFQDSILSLLIGGVLIDINVLKTLNKRVYKVTKEGDENASWLSLRSPLFYQAWTYESGQLVFKHVKEAYGTFSIENNLSSRLPDKKPSDLTTEDLALLIY